jgi:carboxymethylenebutenolidase
MMEKTINIGSMETFVVDPYAGISNPAVVLFMDIWGVREELRDIARKIAAKGYVALLPNLYHRQGNVSNEFYDDGRMISLHRLDKPRAKIVNDQRKKLTNEMILSDIESILSYISDEERIRSGPVGAIGWCMGGWIGLKAGIEFPEYFKAIATLHATRPISESADSPHLNLDKLSGGLYCGWAELDHLSPPSMVNDFESLLEGCRVEYTGTMHHDVEHGYSLPDRDIYSQEASEIDWGHIFNLFRDHL